MTNEVEIRARVLEMIEELAPTVTVSVNDHETPLDELGLDSLDQSGLLLAIEEAYGVKIPDEDAEAISTVNGYVRYLVSHL